MCEQSIVLRVGIEHQIAKVDEAFVDADPLQPPDDVLPVHVFLENDGTRRIEGNLRDRRSGDALPVRCASAACRR